MNCNEEEGILRKIYYWEREEELVVMLDFFKPFLS